MRVGAGVALPLFLVALGAPSWAQEPHAPSPDTAAVRERSDPLVQVGGEHGPAPARVDMITPHITDGHHMEIPHWRPPFYREVHLPEWEPLHLTLPLVGSVTLDLSPTKHVVFLVLAAILCFLVLFTAAAAHRRHHHAAGRPKGFAAGIEAVVLYLRNEVILPNVGHHGEPYVHFCLSLFFFILFANLLGLVPYGATATGNIAVTATLALITFAMIEVAGMRALGWGYLRTVFYWSHDLPWYMNLPMTLIMTPVEIIGKMTKPFALAIRLFANMTAGHVVVLALIGLIFLFPMFFFAPVLMAVAIMLLEIFVAFLQAFIFTLLASVFIGLIRQGAH